jgi:hypothetical protein
VLDVVDVAHRSSPIGLVRGVAVGDTELDPERLGPLEDLKVEGVGGRLALALAALRRVGEGVGVPLAPLHGELYGGVGGADKELGDVGDVHGADVFAVDGVDEVPGEERACRIGPGR